MWFRLRLLCCALSPVLMLGDCVECSQFSPPKFSFTAQRVGQQEPNYYAYADATISVRETMEKPLPICPCVKSAATGHCINYDSRYLAVNLEEAIVEFPDLSVMQVRSKWGADVEENTVTPSGSGLQPLGDPLRPTPLGRSFETQMKTPLSQNVNIQGMCKDVECLFCADLMTRRLMSMGFLDKERFDNIREKIGLQQIDEMQRRGIVGQCKHLRFAMMMKKNISDLHQKIKDMNIDFNATFANVLKRMKSINATEPNRDTVRRYKRTPMAAESGTRFKLDCTRRGQPVDNTEWLGLCNICWVWRRLPPDYFPQYVNELICDEDTKCLSGWGKCKQRERNMEVLRNMGTVDEPAWKAVTINTASFCDCFVQHGTVMHSFIAA